MFVYDRGIQLLDSGLWLDAKRKKDFSFVSHAHADHSARHERLLATPATLALAAVRRELRRQRMKRPPRHEPAETSLPFRKPLKLDATTVTLFPAGHILGSAQVLVECCDRRLLYSGDFCLEASAAAEGIEIPKADTLVMECTYGLPEHRFPPREETVERLLAFIDRTLDVGKVPVLFSYALGKGQEVLKLVTQAGYHAAVESETWELAQVYESFGVSFGEYRLLAGGVREGEVVIAPNRQCLEGQMNGHGVRTAAVTGWAVGGFAHRARRADVRIPLSDHADFEGLINYARAVGPEVVYILHGPSEFGFHLKKAGFTVAPLDERAPAGRLL